jgi:hypothetical protein
VLTIVLIISISIACGFFEVHFRKEILAADRGE